MAHRSPSSVACCRSRTVIRRSRGQLNAVMGRSSLAVVATLWAPGGWACHSVTRLSGNVQTMHPSTGDGKLGFVLLGGRACLDLTATFAELRRGRTEQLRT